MPTSSSRQPATACQALAMVLGFAFAFCAYGQNPTARISGTVSDSSSAVVPNAVVTLIHTDTNAKLEAITNGSGNYVIPSLSPGSYSFTVEAGGFRSYIRTLTLDTGQTLQLDVSLEVGQASESVTVTAATPLLQSSTSDVSHLVEQEFIKNMPVPSARSGALIRLLPGVVFIREETFEPHLNFSMAGGPARAGEYTLDGGNITQTALLTHTVEYNPPTEATQEVKVEANAYPAEYGRSAGGYYSITSKSGTNAYHGVLYENLRNNVLDARSFFSPSVEERKYNVFGVEADGPILRNRTFFMMSYEGTRSVLGQTRIYSFPTPQQVLGDFSASKVAIIDPVTKTPFPGNFIASSRQDPVGAKLAALFPAPNLPGAANNYVSNSANVTSEDSYFAKFDHIFSERDRVSPRVIFYPAIESDGKAIPNGAVDPNASIMTFNAWNLSSGWYHTFRPTLFNEFRYTFARRNYVNPRPPDVDVNGQVGLTGVVPGVPQLQLTGLTSLGKSNQERYLKPQRTYTLTDSVTWSRNRHIVKTGGEWRRSVNHDVGYSTNRGSFTFNNVVTGDAMAALLLGWVTSANATSYNTNTRSDYLGLFVQDDWKVTSRLTLNIGLRYDLDEPRWETHNHTSGFDPLAMNPVSKTPGTVTFAGMNGVSKYAHDFAPLDFGPRFGFAWRAPNDALVVRGGYGLIYGGQYDASLGRALSLGFTDQRTLSPDNGVTAAFLLRNGMPTPPPAPLGPGYCAVPIGQLVTCTPEFINKDHKPITAHHFNVTLQKQFKGTLVELEYLGNMAHHISSSVSYNINEVPPQLRGATQNQLLRPFPQFGNVNWLSPSWGNSTYNSLNVKAEKRFSKGLNFLGTYTWSKFLTDIGGTEAAPALNSGEQSYYAHHLDKGLSGNDFRHRVTISSVYEIPVGKNKAMAIRNRLLDSMIGGWSVGVIAELHSGAPYSVYLQTNRLNSFSAGQRANLVADPSLPTDRPRGQLVAQWFNTAAFANPGNGVLGNASKSPGVGPGFASFDTSFLKDFRVTEKRYFQFRGQFYNLFNRANFGTPNGNLGNAAFGTISSTWNPGRFTQLSLRFVF